MLHWEDPPRTTISWKEVADELAQHPGRWARVMIPTAKTKSNTAYRQLLKWGCEVVVRKVDGEGHGVWARWPEPHSNGEVKQ